MPNYQNTAYSNRRTSKRLTSRRFNTCATSRDDCPFVTLRSTDMTTVRRVWHGLLCHMSYRSVIHDMVAVIFLFHYIWFAKHTCEPCFLNHCQRAVLHKNRNPGSPNGPPMVKVWLVRIFFWLVRDFYCMCRNPSCLNMHRLMWLDLVHSD